MLFLNYNDKILYSLLHFLQLWNRMREIKVRDFYLKWSKVDKIQRFLNIFRKKINHNCIYTNILKNVSLSGITYNHYNHELLANNNHSTYQTFYSQPASSSFHFLHNLVIQSAM